MFDSVVTTGALRRPCLPPLCTTSREKEELRGTSCPHPRYACCSYDRIAVLNALPVDSSLLACLHTGKIASAPHVRCKSTPYPAAMYSYKAASLYIHFGKGCGSGS